MQPLLQIENLSVTFTTDEGLVPAVSNISLTLQRGQVLGLVGESGCGKSVTAMSILRLIPQPPGRITQGRILFEDQDLLKLPLEQLRAVRGRRIAIIFQEPMTALSPLHRIGAQLVEALRLHRDLSPKAAWDIATEWLAKVGIPDAPERMYAWPHQLSGGMRQRVMIAMAMMLEPDLLIADEPTTALDVTVQAQIFDLMRQLMQKDAGLLLITHDMGVIWEMCTQVAVMYASEVVETGPVEAVFKTPRHPYTKALLAAIPANAIPQQRLPAIPGQVPSHLALPLGCHFADRCTHVFEPCRTQHPPLFTAGDCCSRCFLNGGKA
ncbi:MAG TPA: peptide ABC transporter ATP-binding protein [Verrucomicrobia bacterium]|nr:peptide ABC transporter ATP-binding protein [Verrucomicrobiota bacterium]